MDPVKNIKDLVLAINDVSYNDDVQMEFLVAQVKDTLREVFTPDSHYLTYVNSIQFHPRSPVASAEDSQRVWRRGKKQLRDLLFVVLDDRLLRSFESWDDREIRQLAIEPQCSVERPLEHGISSSLTEIVQAFQQRVKVDLSVAQDVNSKTFASLKSPEESSTSSELRELPRIRIDLRDLGLAEGGLESSLADIFGFYSKDLTKRILFLPGKDSRTNEQVRAFLSASEGVVVDFNSSGAHQSLLPDLLSRSGAFSMAVIVLSGDCWLQTSRDAKDEMFLSPTPEACFKLGFLISRLGREKVVVLHKESDYFRRPTGYFEAFYISMGDLTGWRGELGTRLRENKILVRDMSQVFNYQN